VRVFRSDMGGSSSTEPAQDSHEARSRPLRHTAIAITQRLQTTFSR
jgi:hypothetical protein